MIRSAFIYQVYDLRLRFKDFHHQYLSFPHRLFTSCPLKIIFFFSSRRYQYFKNQKMWVICFYIRYFTLHSRFRMNHDHTNLERCFVEHQVMVNKSTPALVAFARKHFCYELNERSQFHPSQRWERRKTIWHASF